MSEQQQAPVFSSTFFLYAIVDGAKYPGQTTIAHADKDKYEEALGDFFNTLAAVVDDQGNDAFVKFEPREVSAARAATPGPGAPLPEAPKNVPPCPIHNVALKEKLNKRTQVKFFSCSQRNQDGTYCNWTPPNQD
jgi:hypothetical protein